MLHVFVEIEFEGALVRAKRGEERAITFEPRAHIGKAKSADLHLRARPRKIETQNAGDAWPRRCWIAQGDRAFRSQPIRHGRDPPGAKLVPLSGRKFEVDGPDVGRAKKIGGCSRVARLRRETLIG